MRWGHSTCNSIVLETASAVEATVTDEPRKRQRHAQRKLDSKQATCNLFGSWFAEKTEPRRSKRHKSAQR